jgi:DNA polymerase I-like protein with 3'-5' exonuclease and polymerase domains
MTQVFLDLSRYDRYSCDTETKGQNRNIFPVGCSIKTPDGQKRYMRWGHEDGGNNCSLPEFQRWARKEFGRSDQLMICHAGPYDMRALANVDIKIGAIVEDTGVVCALLNEYEQNFSLGGLGQKYLGRGKSDQKINEICAQRFGGKPTRKSQAANYWRLSGDLVEEYAEDDADLTLDLYDLKRPEIDKEGLFQVYMLETMVIPVLHRMYQAGVRINIDRAREIQANMAREFKQVEIEWNKHSGGIKFSERKRLISFLLKLGVDLPFTKKGQLKFEEAGGIDDWSFHSADKHALNAITHPVGGMIARMLRLIRGRSLGDSAAQVG